MCGSSVPRGVPGSRARVAKVRTVAWLPQRFVDYSTVDVWKISCVKMVSLLTRLTVFTAVVLLLICPDGVQARNIRDKPA